MFKWFDLKNDHGELKCHANDWYVAYMMWWSAYNLIKLANFKTQFDNVIIS